MNDDHLWCKTNWESCPTLVSAVDHVYVGLQLNSDTTEHVSLSLLQRRDVCDEFVGSLRDGSLLSMEINLQERILMMMIHNASMFAAHGLDKILVPIIRAQGESNELTIALAQKALLKWTECQPLPALSVNPKAQIGEAYELGDGVQQFCHRNAGDKAKFEELTSAADQEGAVLKISRTSDRFGSSRADQPISTVPIACNESVSADSMMQSITDEERSFAPEMMEVILSSLQHTAWLDSIGDEGDKSLSGSVQANIGCELNSILGEGSLTEITKLPAAIDAIPAPLCPVTSASLHQTALISELEASSVVGTDVMGKGQRTLNQSENVVVVTAKATTIASDNVLTIGDKSSIDIAISEKDSNLTQLLISCRAHKAYVQKVTSTSKNGTLAPKLIQQLCQSACSHLIRISTLEYIPRGGEKPISLLSQSQNSQYPTYSQSDEVTDSTGEYAPQRLVQQVYALMSLGLHLAPDDVIAAVSEVLLTQVEEKNKKPLWQKDVNVEPITAVLFLSGVLLPRIRALTAPASRLLFRALEIAVKKTPDLTVSLVLPMMIKMEQRLPPSLSLQSNHQQHEMLLRITRQAVCKDVLDEVVFNLSLEEHKVSRSIHDKESPSELFLATGITIDAMLSSTAPTYSTIIKSKSTSTSSKNTTATTSNKKGSKTSDSASNIGDVSASDQDRLYSTWMDSLSSTSNSTSTSTSTMHTRFGDDDIHLGSVWCNRIGLVSNSDGKTDPDPERLKSINTILNMMTTITPKTARAVMDLLQTMTNATTVTLSSTASSSSIGEVQQAKVIECNATRRSHTVAAVVSIIYTLATRFPKITEEASTGLKKDAVSILSRCGASAVAKAALTALNNLP